MSKIVGVALYILIFMIIYMLIWFACIVLFGMTIGGAGNEFRAFLAQGEGAAGAQNEAAQSAAELMNRFAVNNQSILIAFSSLVSLLIFYKIYSVRKIGLFSAAKADIKPSGADVRYAFFAGASSNYIAGMAISALYGIGLFKGAIDRYQEQMRVPIMNESLFRLVLGLGLIAPLVEEIMFRGMISYELKRVMPVKAVIITQGLMFGLFHLNPVQILYTIPLGIYFGYISYKSGSLWPAVAAHVAINAVNVLNTMPTFEKFITTSDYSWIFIAIVVVMAVSSLTYFIRRKPATQ